MKKKLVVILIALMLFLTNTMFLGSVLANSEEDSTELCEGPEDSIWWRILGEEDSTGLCEGPEDSIWWRNQ